MTYLLYRAAEIRLGDQVVGLGTINRIERKLGEITLHWQHWPGSYVTVGVDTQLLAHRPSYGPPTIDQHSQERGVA